MLYNSNCYPEEKGLNHRLGEAVCEDMNRLKAVLKWDSGRSDEGTALLTGFKDEDGYI